MKKYVHYFENAFEEKGIKHSAGEIFCVTDIGNDCDNCKEVTITNEQYNQIFNYIYKNEVLMYDTYGVDQRTLVLLRDQRSKLLSTFDTYNVNVTRGITLETQAQKEKIMKWYYLMLDLNEEAIQNPPEEIVYFIS